MPPPIVCIDVKECARAFVDGYSAPKSKRLRLQLEATILVMYPEDARDAEAGLRRLDRELHRQRIRATFCVDFEGDGFVLKYARKNGCWALYAGSTTPPDDDDGRDDDAFGDDPGGGGYDALHNDFDRGGDTAVAVMITLDELISRKEMQELCDERLRPAARSVQQKQTGRFLAVLRLQAFFSRARQLWAKLLRTRSRTLVPTEQAAQTASNSPRPVGPFQAAIPADLDAPEGSGLELVQYTVQVGAHSPWVLNGWRRKSPENRQQKRGLFAKKTHNKRLHL